MAKTKIIKKEVKVKIKKDPADSSKPVKLTLGNRVQQIRIYPKYNPLRK